MRRTVDTCSTLKASAENARASPHTRTLLPGGTDSNSAEGHGRQNGIDHTIIARMQKSAARLQAISAQVGKAGGRMKHHLMIGTWTPPGAIFTVEFDDETRSLELIKRTEIPQDQPISWMNFSHDRKNIYGAGMKKWGSYSVQSPTEIKHDSSIAMGGHPRANDSDTKTRAIFVLGAKKAPYLVYGNPFYDHAGFINVHSVHPDGSLKENVQNAPLDERSAVHGMVFDKEEEYLYSADMWSNKIWCHKKARPARSRR
ncbi:Carboxy-cis,cis-muconate [Hortaea werneckii]|nr:Carboxy-cis,cis-muconate [Hortaea werneckii]